MWTAGIASEYLVVDVHVVDLADETFSLFMSIGEVGGSSGKIRSQTRKLSTVT